MSSGTFGYPLGFAAILAALGLAVSDGPMKPAPKPVGSSARAVSSAWTREAINRELIERCDDYVRKYPDAMDLETFAGMAICQFVELGEWDEVGKRCEEFLKRFPDSENRGDYRFFQGLARFDAGDVRGAITIFRNVLREAPYCGLIRSARHYLARSYFLREHAGLEDIPDWIGRAPGPFKREARTRHPFVMREQPDRGSTFGTPPSDAYINPYCFEENDDGSEEGLRVIRDLGEFLARHPDDAAAGSTYCLLGRACETTGNVEGALECYRKAAWSECPDDVAALALDSAAALLLSRDGRAAVVGLYREFVEHRPEGVLTVKVAGNLATIVAGEGDAVEAEKIQFAALKPRIGDPSVLQAEFLIDEVVKSMVPRGKAGGLDVDALDRQLVERLYKIAGADPNATAKARISYARSRLALMLKRKDLCDFHLREIALGNLKDPSALSPSLLSLSGDTLLKAGDLDGAERMFRFMKDHHAAGFGGTAGIGLGKVELARKNPQAALKHFDEVLANHPAPPETTDATIGKLQSLLDLNKNDEVIKLALESVANKAFKGESTARIYLILGLAYEKKAEASEGFVARNFRFNAQDVYQRVATNYTSYPDLRDEALRRLNEANKKP